MTRFAVVLLAGLCVAGCVTTSDRQEALLTQITISDTQFCSVQKGLTYADCMKNRTAQRRAIIAASVADSQKYQCLLRTLLNTDVPAVC